MTHISIFNACDQLSKLSRPAKDLFLEDSQATIQGATNNNKAEHFPAENPWIFFRRKGGGSSSSGYQAMRISPGMKGQICQQGAAKPQPPSLTS